jgi:hypothetical protein
LRLNVDGLPETAVWNPGRRPNLCRDLLQETAVDHVSFLVMKRLAIAEAFTNDKHFEAAGFKVLF